MHAHPHTHFPLSDFGRIQLSIKHKLSHGMINTIMADAPQWVGHGHFGEGMVEEDDEDLCAENKAPF